MNKLIAIACVMICSLSYARTAKEIFKEYNSLDVKQRSAFVDNITTDEWRQIADFELTAKQKGYPSAFFNMISKDLNNLKPLLKEYDGKYADSEKTWPCDNFSVCFRYMPKCTIKHIDNVIGKWRPITAEVYKDTMGNLRSANLLQHITVLAEMYKDADVKPDNGWKFEDYSKLLLSSAPRCLKKIIREKGESFIVGSHGKNTLQDAIDSLTAALNRPRMQGLREWVAEWYPDHEWIEPSWMSEESLNKLMDDVFYGQINFSNKIQNVLRANLGVEDYNEFVKKYNQ